MAAEEDSEECTCKLLSTITQTTNHGRSMTHGMTMPVVPVNQIDNREFATLARASEALLIVPKPFA